MTSAEKELHKCCICGLEFSGFGNNPDGAVWKDKDGNITIGCFKENDRCCDNCDGMYVIPGRLFLLGLKNKAKTSDNK